MNQREAERQAHDRMTPKAPSQGVMASGLVSDGLLKMMDSMVTEKAMGIVTLTSLGKRGIKGIERMGRRPSLRRAKKRIYKLSRRGLAFRAGANFYVTSDDPRDFASARAFLRSINREARRRWAGLSDEERNAALHKEQWGLIGLSSVSLVGAYLGHMSGVWASVPAYPLRPRHEPT
jgi:hypothetical protein